jgi:hypothetical protein
LASGASGDSKHDRQIRILQLLAAGVLRIGRELVANFGSVHFPVAIQAEKFLVFGAVGDSVIATAFLAKMPVDQSGPLHAVGHTVL